MTTDTNANVTKASRHQRAENRRSALNYLYFMRFSILLWLSPMLLIVLDNGHPGLIKSMVHGLLALEHPWQFVSAGALVFFACAAAMVTARIVCAYGPERFNVAPPKMWEVGSQMSWWVVARFQLPALALSIYLVCRRDEPVRWFAGAMGILAGWVFALGFIFLLAWLHNRFHKPVAEGQPYHAVLLPLRGKVLRDALDARAPAWGWGFRWLTTILGAGYCGSDGELIRATK